MRRVLTAAFVVVGLGLAMVSWDPFGLQAQVLKGLPGAVRVVDAAEFPSLQAAIDALPETGGVVQLPPGVFEIRQPLRVTTPETCIRGAGSATHIKNVNESGEPAFIVQSPPDGSGDQSRPQPLWRVQLSDFRITGNQRSGHGIVARRINEIYIHGLTVTHHGGDGILLDHCYEDPRVCNSLITYNGETGLNLLGCHDIVVSGNQFEENKDALRCINGFNLCMTGNCLDDHLGDGVVIENTYGSVLSGNMIEECKGRAVVMSRDCYGNTLSANVIAHNMGGGVHLIDAHGCAVSANTFTISGGDAMYLGPQVGRITITGNNFSNSYIGDGAVKRAENDRMAGGLKIDGARDLVIVGNTFAGVHPKAVAIANSPQAVLFEENQIVDAVSDLAAEDEDGDGDE